MAERLKGEVRIHEAFRTAAVWLPGGLRIDVATARTERYRTPAALPEVTPGTLREDLLRRDFTINALAVRLAAPGFGVLIDPFDGRRDLREGKIRVLHERSFVDDPTRAFRAVRFAVRLEFEIERETSDLIRSARREGAFAALSAQRLRREVELVLEEQRLVRAVEMLSSLDLLTVIHPSLKLTQARRARLERAAASLEGYRRLHRDEPARGWVVALGVLAERFDAALREELVARLRPGRLALRSLIDAPRVIRSLSSAIARRRRIAPSRIHELCVGHPTEVLLLAMALSGREEVRRAVGTYLSGLQDVRLDIRGADLVRAGVPAGPRIATGLDAALRAKLDGRAPDADRQLATALAAARGT